MNTNDHYWTGSISNLLDQYEVNGSKGLSTVQAKARKKVVGENLLRTKAKVRAWEVLMRQLKSIIVALLFSAALISLFFSHYMEAISIFCVLVVNTLIGFFTEIRAIRSMESLRKMGVTSTKVLRDSNVVNLDAKELVPGDIVFLEGGDVVTADIRLIESAGLICDESTFSGESLSSEKFPTDLREDVSILERTNTVFKGTSILRGSATGVVVATGSNTELGKIAKLTDDAKEELTPLEKRLGELGEKLIKITLFLAIIITISGVWAGHEITLMLKVSIALAVAAIPEGLPIVATIALAKGMLRMANNNALINKLSAVETLGAITAIFTDKTGTLTENKMQVSKLQFSFGEVHFDRSNINLIQALLESKPLAEAENNILKKSLEVGALCTNAKLNYSNEQEHVGDTMEIALLKTARDFGILKEDLQINFPKIGEEAFNFEQRRMATIHRNNNSQFFAVKGAPESILKISQQQLTNQGLQPLSQKMIDDWLSWNDKLASQGFRVLGLAYKEASNEEKNSYQNLIFLALVCFRDPPRAEIKDSIYSCKRAGIIPIMVTGDQTGTALNVAKEIGLVDVDYQDGVLEGKHLEGIQNDELIEKIFKTRIFSRVTPKQKLELINVYQKKNNVVAMTGDGVNDAPALKKADIGIAMGLRGTQVAKEASDMILKDDSFSSIIKAIYQGRVIFNNIKLFVIYLLSCNISEIFIVSIATVFNFPLPLMPLQILFLNLVTDVFPALALGMGDGDSSFSLRKPRDPSLPIIGMNTWRLILVYGGLLTFSVLAAFLISIYYYSYSSTEVLTISFLTLGVSQIIHVFNMRSASSGLWRNEVTRNPHIWGAVIFCFILLISVVYIHPFNKILDLVAPSQKQWFLIAIFSFVPLLTIQISKWIWKKFRESSLPYSKSIEISS